MLPTRVWPLGRRCTDVGWSCGTVASQTTLPSASYSTTLLLLYCGARMRPLGSTSMLLPYICGGVTVTVFSSLPVESRRCMSAGLVMYCILAFRDFLPALMS